MTPVRRNHYDVVTDVLDSMYGATIDGLSFVPDTGILLADFDIDQTEVWVVAGPSRDGDTIAVARVEVGGSPYGAGRWEAPLGTVEVTTISDMFAAIDGFLDEWAEERELLREVRR